MAYPLEIASAAPLPEDLVIAYCKSSDRRRPSIAGQTPLALLNPNLVVKFGWGVYEEEFLNQEFAYRTLDPSVVRVPKPVRFFRAGLSGYLVMEWMDLTPVGRSPADLDAVAKALQHIHAVAAPEDAAPGPVGGGCCRGDRFNDQPMFDDKADLQNFLNHRYRGWGRRLRSGIPFQLHDQPLVFAHLDIAARNLGRMPDGTVCVLDWAMAGFFPRWFDHGMMEACCDALPMAHEVNMFKTDLLEAMEGIAPLTEAEREMKNALICVVDNCWLQHL